MATAFNAQLNVQLNAQSLNTASKEIRQSLGRITGSASEFQKSLDASTARVFAFGATTLVIDGITQSFKTLVTTTIDVEKRLIEINSIFGGTASQFAAFRDTIFDVAKSTGQSFNVVADGAAEFARQGLSASETAKRLEAALILTRVSGLDSVKSVNALTSAINGFTSASLTAAQVTNKLVAVDTAFAVSSQDLAEGFSRAGSTAEDAGVSFDELLGIITAVQQKTARGGAVIGNALKSIFTRLSRSSTITDLQELGVAIDSSQSGIQKLQALSNALEQISDPSQASAIKELAGGVYQINIVSAALKDLSSQSSIFSQATATSAKATNEAYSKNEQLNKSLAAQINQLIVGVTNLAEKAGQLTFAPLLSNLVGIATKISEFFDKALDPEKGNAFIQGIFKAIGTFISGPGLVLVTGAFLKIISLVAKFAKEGFSSVLQIGSETEKIKSIQQGIVIALKEDAKFRAAIESGTLTQAGLEKAVNDKIRDRNILLQQQQKALETIAKIAIKQGAVSFDGARGYLDKRGKPVTTKASGFTPSFKETMAETSAAREHGYTAGKVYNTRLHDGSGGSFKATVNSAETVKTVRGANGKLGTYVIPPNGFHSNGFVPNYANIATETSTRNLLSIINNKSGRKTPAEVEAAKNRLGQLGGNQVSINKILASQGIKELPTVLTPNTVGVVSKTKKNFMGTGKDASYLFKAFPIKKGGIDQLEKEIENDFSDKAIDDFATTRALRLAQSVSLAVGSNPATPETLDKVDGVKGFRGAIRSAFGSLFDAALTTGLGLSSSQKDGGDFDVRLGRQKDPKQTLKNIRTLFGSSALGSKGLADFKIGGGDTTAESMIRKTNNEYGSLITKGMGIKNKASGFIPNFASYVYDSDKIPADKGATLKAILASKAKKNLLIAPSGAGKSTLAAKYGKFLSGASDVSKASEINLLSGAARAKGGGMSKQLESLLDSVNASGGKVSYLHVKNMEIMKRRMGRASLEGDLRSEKQLKGTRFAPLNQFDFIKAVKSRAKRFEVLSAGGGFVPNFVRKSREIGSGAFGTFFRLGKNKEGSDVGVKKFKSYIPSRSIEAEWLTSEFVNKYANIPSVFGPANMSTFEESKRKRAIRKAVVSDPLARTAVGSEKASAFGQKVLFAAFKARGLEIGDFHGSNYTLNKNAQDAINGMQSFPSDPVGAFSVLRQIAASGGRIGAIDVGAAHVTDPARGIIGRIMAKQASSGKASGFVPNFAGSQRNHNAKITAIQIAKGLGKGLLKQLIDQYLGDGFVDNIEAAGLRKMNLKDVSPFLAELKKPTRSKHQRAFDTALMSDPLMQAQFPQRYRVLQAQIAEQIRLDSAGGGFMPNFSAIGDAINREKAAGVPSSKIYLDSSPQLKSSRNPMGMMVANSLDEPSGGFQGINRARKEGRNPKTYGAAGGFVPNYANGETHSVFSDRGPVAVMGGASALVVASFGLLAKIIYDEIKNRKLLAAEDKKILDAAKKLADARQKELAAIQASTKARIMAKYGIAPIAGGVGGGKGISGFGKGISGFDKKLGRLNEGVGKVQGGLLALSVASSTLAADNQKLSNIMNGAISGLAVLSILGPAVLKAKTVLAGLTVATAAPFAIAAAAIAAVAVPALLLANAFKRIEEAQSKTDLAEKKYQTRTGQIRARDEIEMSIAGVDYLKREEISATEKEYQKARSVKIKKEKELYDLEEKFSVFGKYAGVNKTTFEGGEIIDSDPEVAKKRKEVEEARLKQEELKVKVDEGSSLKKGSRSIISRNLQFVKEAASKTGVDGQRATQALTSRNEAAKQLSSFEKKQLDLIEKRDIKEKEAVKLEGKWFGGEEEAKQKRKELADIDKEIKELESSIKNASIVFEYSQLIISDIFENGSDGISQALDDMKISFVKSTKEISKALEDTAEKLRRQNETLDMAKGITPASGELSERTSNQLELKSLITNSASAGINFYKGFSNISDVFDPSTFKLTDDPEKKRDSALKELVNNFTDKDGVLKEDADFTKTKAQIERTFENEKAGQIKFKQTEATRVGKGLEKEITSGELQKGLFSEFAKGGEEAFEKAFQSKFSTTNIEDGKGKELYDKLLEGAKGFKETIKQSYTTALNMQTTIQNKIRDTGLELIEAQKKALSDITSTVKGILDGPKSDPTKLFQKFEEAAKLLKTGDPKDAQKANKILADVDEQTKAFRDKYGEESLRGLQSRAGMTTDMTAKSKASAVMQMTDFGTIEDIIKNSLSGVNQRRLSNALEAGKADPSKMGAFLDMVEQTFTGRLAEKGNQITGSLGHFDSAGEKKRMFENVDRQLYAEQNKGLLDGGMQIQKNTAKSVREYKKDSGSAENFEKMLKALQENYGTDKGTKIAEAYKKAATKKDEFSPEDDITKGLTERQKALQVELNETTEMVNKFKTAFDGKDGGITTSISALKIAIDDAATGVTGFKTLTQSLSDISNGIGPVLDKVREDISALQRDSLKVSGK